MRKSISVLIISIGLGLGLRAQTYDRQNLWDKEISAFAEIDRKQTPPPNPVLFVGSSSIRMWTNLRSSFPRLKVMNRGFGGSRFEDVNYYFDRIVTPYNPKTIVIYAGENDINEGVEPEKVLEHYRNFAAMVKEKLPKTDIIFVSLKPSPARWNMAGKFKQTNALIKAEIEKGGSAQFVDVFTPMLDEKGEPKEEIFREDRLHLNEKGYTIWRSILQRYLQ
jgi:lysophospholipase L1-like esterase